MVILILYLLLALSISFLCSVIEAVLLSVTPSFIETREREGADVKMLKRYKESIDKPLSAILSLNTVAHTIGAAGVGAQATALWGSEVFGIVSVILTILILVLSEILPKTIGAKYWKSLAITSSKVINCMIVVTYPLVIISDFMTRLFKKGDSNKTSREEISVLVEMGTKAGIIQERENTVIQNLINMTHTTVEEAMTPRTVVVAAKNTMTLNELITDDTFKAFTRIPIFEDDIDDTTGYILRSVVYEQIFRGNGDATLKSVEREFVVVYNNLSLASAWKELLLRKEHIALVIDQYGGVDGIISMEDIIESIFGLEIIDERDASVDMQQLARDRWKKRQLIVEEIL